jgi:hypothetical protein
MFPRRGIFIGQTYTGPVNRAPQKPTTLYPSDF